MPKISNIDDEKKALESFLLDISCLDELKPFTNRVNVFDVLRSTRTEIRHSNVLAWLLNANENHGLGDLFLRMFIESVLKNSTSYNICEWSTIELESHIVEREWQPNGKKSLDILVLCNSNHLIAIENKIDSTESEAQTRSYKELLEKAFPSHEKMLVYLTPDGEDASDIEWNSLTYGEIRDIIKKILTNQSLNEKVRFILADYLEILENDIMENEEIVKICNKIYDKHKEALDLIFENKNDYMVLVANKIKKALTELHNEGKIIYSENDSSGSSFLRFKTEAVDKIFPDLKEGEENGSDWKNKKTAYFFEIDTHNLKIADNIPIYFTLTSAIGEENKKKLGIKKLGKTKRYKSHKDLIKNSKINYINDDFTYNVKASIIKFVEERAKELKEKI